MVQLLSLLLAEAAGRAAMVEADMEADAVVMVSPEGAESGPWYSSWCGCWWCWCW